MGSYQFPFLEINERGKIDELTIRENLILTLLFKIDPEHIFFECFGVEPVDVLVDLEEEEHLLELKLLEFLHLHRLDWRCLEKLDG